jgi:hypothetical protein
VVALLRGRAKSISYILKRLQGEQQNQSGRGSEEVPVSALDGESNPDFTVLLPVTYPLYN